jgi:hypothetical protein
LTFRSHRDIDVLATVVNQGHGANEVLDIVSHSAT